jgi:hypothetical protein
VGSTATVGRGANGSAAEGDAPSPNPATATATTTALRRQTRIRIPLPRTIAKTKPDIHQEVVDSCIHQLFREARIPGIRDFSSKQLNPLSDIDETRQTL